MPPGGRDCWLPHDSGAGLCWQHVGGVGSTTTTTSNKFIFASVFQNETLDNIPALNCADNSDGKSLPEVVITPEAVFNKLETINLTKSES